MSNRDGDQDVYVMNRDGSGVSNVTNTSGVSEHAFGWAAPTGYPRPAGASPLHVSLVTAYDECTAPNRTHGPPFDSASCNPPTRSSAHLTVGTADSNGQVVRFKGHLRLRTILGNPSTPADEADVGIDFFSQGALTNALGNYTGELRAEVPLRIIDRDNTPTTGRRHDAGLHLQRRCHLRGRPRSVAALLVPDHHDRRCPDTRLDQGGPTRDLAGRPGGRLGRRARRRHRHAPATRVFARQGVFIP